MWPGTRLALENIIFLLLETRTKWLGHMSDMEVKAPWISAPGDGRPTRPSLETSNQFNQVYISSEAE